MIEPQNPTLLRVTSVGLRGLFRLFGGFEVRGLENVPRTGPAILAPNHHSWADPPAVRIAIRRRLWFMGNAFLFNIPVLGRILPLYGAFPVKRGEMDRDALRIAEGHLKAEDLICVFPEGGTTVTGRLYPFEGGVALLALRNRVPIIPVGITGTDKLLPMQPPFYPRYAQGGVTLTFGPPVHPDEVDPALPRRDRIDLLTQRLYHAVAALLPPDYLPEDYSNRQVARDAKESGAEETTAASPR